MISKNSWLSKAPFIVAVVLYALISYGYFTPQIGGRVLYQHDVQQYDGMTQEILESREATGEDPQWTGAMFSGMPAYLINVAYPAQIIKTTVAKVVKLMDTPAAFIFFAMLSMWLMLVMMGCNGWVAIVGGLMYGLSTYFFLIIEAGHITKMWALAYAPMMFGGVHIALRRDMWWGASLAALFASLEIGANHPQITYYFGLAILAFWISELYYSFKESKLREFSKRTALLIVAAILAVCSNLAPLWYTYEHTPDTIRGGSELIDESSRDGGLDMEYATAWSYGRTESLNMIVPNFVGGSSFDSFSEDGAVAEALAPYNLAHLASQLPTYWGDQSFTGGPTYIGAVVIFLALLGLLLVSRREKWWLLAISMVMLMLAWGRHMMWFSELMFNILPGYDKFRTVSMTLVILEWSAPLLATYALAILWRGEHKVEEIKRKLLIAASATAGLLAILCAGGTALFDYGREAGFELLIGAGFPDEIASQVARAMASERHSILCADSLRSIAFILATAGVVLLSLMGRIKRGVTLSLIALLVVVDLVPVNKRYLNDEDFVAASAAKIRPTQADKAILEDKDLGYRVFNLSVSPFNDATTSYFHRSVGGYHGAKLSRYQDIISTYLASQSSNNNILDMLNTRYTIYVGDEDELKVRRRTTAYGPAWFVDSVVRVSTAREEIDMLRHTDLRRVAVVDNSQRVSDLKFGSGSVELVEYHSNYLRYETQAETDATIIFSEIFYDKGWSAYIDGVETPYFRADYILRAMELPAGSHTIEWRFKAPRWTLIEGITLFASLIIILSIILRLTIQIYERRQKTKA